MPDAMIKQLLASSGLVFTGTVSAVGTSSVAGVTADERTAVVEVTQTGKAPAEVQLPVGARVTVQLSAELPTLQPGAEATFFTNPVVYGDELAVVEVGRMPVAEVMARTAAVPGRVTPVPVIEAALIELAQEQVLEHARAADAAVRGRVISLAEAPTVPVRSEHDPQWWVAVIAVDLVAKGNLPAGHDDGVVVNVLYANSVDIAWHESPKPKAGQAGLWLLHRTDPEHRQLASFQLLHPLDLQPSTQLELLRQEL